MADLVTESLTETQWQISHAIAQSLIYEQTDVNELGKAIAYLRKVVNQRQSDAGLRFFKYLKTLVTNGRQIGHSSRTTDYYRSIERVCTQYLQGEQANAHTMLVVLGWAARLMRYYKEVDIDRDFTIISPSLPSSADTQRQVEIQAVTQSQRFEVGQILDAEVTSIKGKEVTYTILGTIKLTVKEPKKYDKLSIGKIAQVKILEIKDDGSPRKIKSTD